MARSTRVQAVLVVRHYAGVAHGSMRRQYQRLIRASPPHLDDGYLFALALADLFKAGRVARRQSASPNLRRALAEFERAVPQAKDFRDLLEHWEAYAEGKGRAQERLGLSKGRHWFWWASRSPLVLRIGGSKAGLDLDVEKAKTAGSALFQSIQGALDLALRET